MAVVVTMDEYGRNRRYVVDERDADQFTYFDEDNHFYFGAQWVRGRGRVDECHRILSSREIVRISHVDDSKVYG